MAVKEVKLSLEVVILLIGGMALSITGTLLFPVSSGALPYDENGLYGLLLILFVLQMITLGKTPFGDLRRSRALLAIGVIIGAVGIFTCLIPLPSPLPRAILFLCFGPGGLFLLLHTYLSKDKFRAWSGYGGPFHHLIRSSTGVYVLSTVLTLTLWKPDLLPTPLTGLSIILFGSAVFYLAWVLQKIYWRYPQAERRPTGDIALSTDQAILLLMGVFLLILGTLLIPVNLGLLPFSVSGQLGLLMVIFAVQMLASGSTLLGPFSRSWPVTGAGFLFAASGIASCIIPGILVAPLTILVGLLNILGGAIGLARIAVPLMRRSGHRPAPLPPPLARLFPAQATMNVLAILFGTTMLIPGLLHGLVIGAILAANGCVLLYLLRILSVLDRIGATTGDGMQDI